MTAVTDELAGSSVDPESPARVSSRYDNRITLQKLEVFCSVIELGGVSRAADHLWVAQSVVSGHLRSLQERLGVQVLYRDGQRMKLTKAGEQVYQWAKEMLAGTRDLMRRLDDLDDANSGTLALAASLTVGSYLLPPILAGFRRALPRAIITMQVSDPERAFAAVGSGECDLGIVIAGPGHEHPHVRSEEIGREEIVLVAAPDRLAGIDELQLADLAKLALVAPFAGSVARDVVDRRLMERGVPPQTAVMELGHPEAMKRVIRHGVDACLLFRSCVEDELRQGTLREIPFADADLSMPVFSLVHSERPPLPIQMELVEQTRARLAAR
ncbi:LysR family transcriptional regulator [Amycolatopsis pithecellobii]|uniref:LysR family transcriptional regulator n=1 Tax=Amycolatopsis pithecellobii TaxID=664692 RepID=A0A6N7YU11_9PSEU|nr:LysR substrate-binding domain-containing protein [Amycolatopsis pithecellobii]MTD55418.1 LysR family transcriptional regulator [Amycolatopsis pithecellobii]